MKRRIAHSICPFLVFIGFAAGCGEIPQTDAFRGSWSWSSGSTVNLNCPNDNNSGTLSDRFTILEGTTSDIVMSYGECDYKFDLNGDLATIQNGQTCEYSTSDGTDISESWSVYDLELTGDTLRVTANGAVELSNGVNSIDCTSAITGTASKVGS